jgi:hypothetical protein
VLMIPLAITSTADWIRRLGGKRWQKLHRLIYASAVAGVIHYYWLVKSVKRTPKSFPKQLNNSNLGASCLRAALALLRSAHGKPENGAMACEMECQRTLTEPVERAQASQAAKLRTNRPDLLPPILAFRRPFRSRRRAP